MWELSMRYRIHVGLAVSRAAALVLVCLAGVTVAGNYLPFPAAPLVGGLGGLVVGVLADRVSVAYGRRLGWLAYDAHVTRQAASRDRSAREAGARGNTGRDLPLDTRSVRTACGATAVRVQPGPAGAAAAAAAFVSAAAGVAAADGSRLVADTDRRVNAEPAPDASLDEATAIGQLCDLVRAELTPTDLAGRQGRGVIQLAALLGPLVPLLDPETVVEYVSDHVLVAAGHCAVWPARWYGALDRVTVLPRPGDHERGDTGQDEVFLLGIAQAYDGHDPGPFLDKIVGVISNSGVGLRLAQLGVALDAKGWLVGPYTLAVLLKFLVDQGRLVRSDGSSRYQLTPAEWERVDAHGARDRECRGSSGGALSVAAAGGDDPPLAVVWSALAGGEPGGMSADAVARAVGRRGGFSCTLAQAESALRVLVSARRASCTPDTSGRYVAVTHGSLIMGPGLRERVQTAVDWADATGLTIAEITERVNADGFGATDTSIAAVVAGKVTAGDLYQASSGRIASPPF